MPDSTEETRKDSEPDWAPHTSLLSPNARWELTSLIPVLTAFPRVEGLRDPKWGKFLGLLKKPEGASAQHTVILFFSILQECHTLWNPILLPSLTVQGSLRCPGFQRRAPRSALGFGSRSSVWKSPKEASRQLQTALRGSKGRGPETKKSLHMLLR